MIDSWYVEVFTLVYYESASEFMNQNMAVPKWLTNIFVYIRFDFTFVHTGFQESRL